MYDIYVATGALIVATAIQLIVTFILYKKIEKMQLITFAMVSIFGSMTILLHDENFIKWKVTIVYAIFATGLAISHVMGKSSIKAMLGKEITLPDAIWAKINWAWVAFFSFCAGLNLYVAHEFPLDVWVNFKVFGLLFAMLAYMVATGFYIYKHMPKEQEKQKGNSSDVSLDD